VGHSENVAPARSGIVILLPARDGQGFVHQALGQIYLAWQAEGSGAVTVMCGYPKRRKGARHVCRGQDHVQYGGAETVAGLGAWDLSEIC
jgi:hypothetical protein